MSDWLRIGAQCVCVKKEPWVDRRALFGPAKDAPKFGEVLTVSGIFDGPDYALFLSFEEKDPFDLYWAVYFRPLVQSDLPTRREVVPA